MNTASSPQEGFLVPLHRGDGLKVLIVDDNQDFQFLLRHYLERESFSVWLAEGPEECGSRLERQQFDVVLLDIELDGDNGLSLLPMIVRLCPLAKILVLSHLGTLHNGVSAIKNGAVGFIEKSGDLPALIDEICSYLNVAEPIEQPELLEMGRNCGIVGSHSSLIGTLERIWQMKDVDSTVLVCGESGSGKELVACALHNLSRRSSAPFRAINCGAIPPGLLESMLFGHRKGSFTDAKSNQVGILELCSNGTVLLDEIADMPLELQVKLLRAIQEREVLPVGAQSPVKINTRIIAATNKDLNKQIKEGLFRSDLFYRISVLEIYVPALRERRTDIPELIRVFLRKYNELFGKSVQFPTFEVLSRFMSHDWPGNIRELQNCVERGVVLTRDEKLHLEDVFEHSTAGPKDTSVNADRENLTSNLKDAKYDFMKIYLTQALAASGGNVTHASQLAGCHRVEFHRLVKRYDIDPADFRRGE